MNACPTALRRLRAAACAAVLLLSLAAGLWTVRKEPSILTDPGQSAESREEAFADHFPKRAAALAPSRMLTALLDRRYFPKYSLYRRSDGMLLQGGSSGQIGLSVENVTAFCRFCTERGKRFLYVILPGKPAADTDLTDAGIRCQRNASADAIRDRLLAAGVPCVDLRPLYAGDFYRAFNRTDHHWTADAGLRAASAILEALNRQCGYSFDLSRLDPSAFDRQVLPDAWIGEEGKQTLGEFGARDDFIALTPKEAVRLSYTDPAYGTRTGGFEILLDPDALVNPDRSAYYYYLSNTRIAELRNAGADSGDLLVVRDSFANTILPFMALEVSRITAWSMQEDADVCGWIDAHPETETVLIVYNISFMTKPEENDFGCLQPETEGGTGA